MKRRGTAFAAVTHAPFRSARRWFILVRMAKMAMPHAT